MNYKNVKIDKSMYKSDIGFNSQLERVDPSENYVGTPLEGLDAFQRQLKRFDIKVSGSNSDKVSKFFATGDSAALFPEFVARAVASGADVKSPLEQIIASSSVINSLDYRSITTDIKLDKDDVTHDDSVFFEGGKMPETSILLNESLVKLIKRGRMLTASYEAIKHQRSDVVAVALSQIGASIARDQLYDAIRTLIAGNEDGNREPEFITVSSKLTYDNLLDFWNSFTQFDMNTLIVSPKSLKAILTLPEFKETGIGESFHSTGSLITPFGAKIVRANVCPDGFIIGLDSKYALEMVTTGGVQVEYDKLIDTQLERAAVSTTYGFNLLFPDAVKVLDINAAI